MRVLRGLVASVVLVCGASAQGGSNDELRRLLVDGGHQIELPGDVDGVGNDGARRMSRDRSSSPSSPGWFSVSSGAAAVLMWTVVGVAAAVLIAAVVRQSGGSLRSEPRPKGTVRGASPAPTADDRPSLDDPRFDPRELAAAGDFAGALRVLLSRAFFVANGGAANVAPHATARELLRRLRRTRLPVEPVAELVAVVERVHFGGQPADRAMYEAASASCAAWESRVRKQPANGGAS